MDGHPGRHTALAAVVGRIEFCEQLITMHEGAVPIVIEDAERDDPASAPARGEFDVSGGYLQDMGDLRRHLLGPILTLGRQVTVLGHELP